MDGIPKYATIVAPLKYQSNFWISHKILLINWKVEFKLRKTKRCVLTAAAVDNVNANGDNISFTSKTENCILLSSLYQ